MNLIKEYSGDSDCDRSYTDTLLAKTTAFYKLGFDYVTIMAAKYTMIPSSSYRLKTASLNENAFIIDRESFDKFQWNDPLEADYSPIDVVANSLPMGMKIINTVPGGILENVIDLVGYDNLCYMLYDDRQLVYDLFEKVGSLIYAYYKKTVGHKAMGALLYNDDWGFCSQTLLPPDDLRELVFPWCKKIVSLASEHGLPVILHSCGYFTDILPDILNMGFAAKHSYEDKIMPVEEAYELLKSKIAVLGGIDVNYLVNETQENIFKRAQKLLEQTAETGGYALGSGNSIPDYIPTENFLAMIRAAGIKV